MHTPFCATLRNLVATGAGLVLTTTHVFSVISIDTNVDWVAIEYDTPSDYIADQQTGQPEADLIGQPGYSSFFKAYDDGGTAGLIDDDFIGFRFRVRSDENPPGFSKYGFVGMDANGDGSIDVFIGGNQNGINFYSPGTDLNVSPNTTSVANLTSADTYLGETVDWQLGTGASIFNFSSVTSVDPSLNLVDPAPFASLPASDPFARPDSTTGDLDGGLEVDYFVSFKVDMATLIKAVYVSTDLNPNKTAYTLDLESTLSFIVVTSTQDNSFNQDLNGQDGDALDYRNSTATWIELGAASKPYTADGQTPVPEPTAYALCFGSLALACAGIRRKRVRA